MFDTLLYRWRLWRLRRERDRTLAPIRKILDAAVKANDEEGKMDAISEMLHEEDEFEEKIQILRTRHLHEMADRYLVPIPPLSEKEAWTHSELRANRVYLSAKGAAQVQAQIRAEQKHRREERDALLPWLGALTGLIGALTGLVAVWYGS